MRKLLCLMLAVVMVASVAVIGVNAAGTATVTLENVFGDTVTQTYAVGETFTAYIYLNTNGKIGSVDGTLSYDAAILEVTDEYVKDEDDYDFGLVDDLDAMFPVLGDATIANAGNPGSIFYNASTPSITNGFPFTSDASPLIIVNFKVIDSGEATIKNSMTTLAVADKDLTRIIDKGNIVQDDFAMPIALSVPAAPAGFTVSGKATSYKTNDGVDDVTLKLTGTDNNFTAEVTVTAVYSGIKADTDYSFENVPAGSYTLTVEKGNHVTRTYEVAVSADTTQDVKICPIGDADNNGRVNSADAKVAFQHGNDEKPITDDYKFACADVASPKKKVNSVDAKGIFQHVNDQKSLWTVTAE